MSESLTLLLLAAASFSAAAVSASLSVGGGYVLFGATTLLYPLPVAIALQPVLSYSSLVARSLAFREATLWGIVRPFTLGSLGGVALGLVVYHAIPERGLALGVGLLMLVLAWSRLPLPQVHSRAGLVGVGAAHALSGTVLGMGSILQPVLLNAGIDRRALVGTFATCLLVLEAIRCLGYAATGFGYRPYLLAVVVSTLAGFAGTWAGKQVIGRIPERAFRAIVTVLITVLAIRLLVRAVVGSD
ncbi:MAG: sulfite exporter TauE/SafE family protein [Erythrobacter sp.]|nr:sulfite exporter TauE/SafE family protein [Erythrobacter sp.]